jgi:hypothetical protein
MSRLVYCKDSEPATLPISITTQEPTNVIEIQPKAVKRFRENIESLAQIVRDKDGEASPEIAVHSDSLWPPSSSIQRKRASPTRSTSKATYQLRIVGD